MQNSHHTNPVDPPPYAPPPARVPTCAPCRHLRRKCTKNCVLAPFFPAEKAQDFHLVHKVFGVGNLTKFVKSLSQEDRKLAVESLIWEANCWLKDPVLGPWGEFQKVSQELGAYQQANYIHRHLPQQVPIADQNAVLHGVQQPLIGSWINGDNYNEISSSSMLGNIHSTGGFDINSRGGVFNCDGSLQQTHQEHGFSQQMMADSTGGFDINSHGGVFNYDGFVPKS